MEFVSLLPLVAIVLLFWLMVVRPASRRQKELARVQHSLQPGQRVMLSSGLFGTVRSLTEDRARLEVAPGVEVEVVRAAVHTVEGPQVEGTQVEGTQVDGSRADGSTDAGTAGPVPDQP